MKTPTRYWLLKSEGDSYPIDQLQRDKKTAWTGVRNYQARNFMREMNIGDLCLFYHSGMGQKGVFGIARVASKPYPDPTQFDKTHYYFDAKSKKEDPAWTLVDIAFKKKFKHPVDLAEMRTDPALMGMALWRANRLSVQPVSEKHYVHIVGLSEEK